VKFVDNTPIDSKPTSSQQMMYFVGGLFPPEREIDATELCPKEKRIDQVEFLYSGIDVFWNVITLNLYSPKTLNVWCS
jgi:hypothetical protein